MSSSLTPTRLRTIKNILNLISGVLIGLAVLTTIIYHITFFGMQVRNITTTSMVPAISKNDAVLVATHNVGAVAPGEIVAYKAEWLNDNMVVHRVTKVDGDTITVKGDANSTSDPAFDKSRIVGKVDTVIPHVGWFFTTPGFLTTYGLGVLSALASYLLGRKLPQRRKAVETAAATPVANTASPRRLFRSNTTAADEGEVVLPRRAAAEEVVEGVVLPSSDEEGFIDQSEPAFAAPKRAAAEEPEETVYVPAHGYDPDEVEEAYVPAHAAENDDFDFVDADLGGLDTSFIPVVKDEQPVAEQAPVDEVVEAVPSTDEASDETAVRMGGFHLYCPEPKEPEAAEPVADIVEPVAEEPVVYTPRRGFVPDDEEGEPFFPAHAEAEPEAPQVDEVAEVAEVDEASQSVDTEAVEQTHTDLPVIEEEFTKITTETEPTPEETVYTEAEFEKAVEAANEARTPDLAETSAEFVEGATIKSDGLVELDTSNYTPAAHEAVSEASEPSSTVSETKPVETKHVSNDGINDDEFINSDDEDELDSLPDLS